MKKTIIASAAGAILAFGAGSSLAAAPADWSKVAAKDITLLDPCMGSGHFVVAMFETIGEA